MGAHRRKLVDELLRHAWPPQHCERLERLAALQQVLQHRLVVLQPQHGMDGKTKAMYSWLCHCSPYRVSYISRHKHGLNKAVRAPLQLDRTFP